MQDVHFGPFPPPLGGITVYLYRLSKLNKNSQFIDEKKIIGFRKISLWFIKQVIDRNKKNFIYHNHSLVKKLLLYVLSLISVHDFSLVIHGRAIIDRYDKSNAIFKWIIRKMLSKANFIQVVNPDYKKFMLDIGIKQEGIFIKNAFLPPPLEDEKNIYDSYNRKILNFIENRSPLLIANAYALSFYKDEDQYGLDLCIELISMLKKEYPSIGFLFALADHEKNNDYLDRMKKRIVGSNIENNFLFMTGQKELWPLIKKSDIMIRATNIDGDSISVREALHFKIPVITSDAVKRPDGCLLFKNRDLTDLYSVSKNKLVEFVSIV